MSNKLLFTAAVAIGGLLTGAVAATGIPQAIHSPAPLSKPAIPTPATTPKLGGHVYRLKTPQTSSSPGTAPFSDKFANGYKAPSYPIWAVSLDNRDASVEPGEATALSELSGYSVHNSVWVTWTAPASGTASIDTNGSATGLDTSLEVFTGSSIKHSKRITWNDDSGTAGYFSHIVGMPFTKGVTYHIQVGSSEPRGVLDPNSPARTGALGLNFRASFLPPSNDNLHNAITKTGISWTAKGYTGGSTIETGSELISNPASSTSFRVSSIWYRWTATASGTMTVTESSVSGASYQAIYENAQTKTFVQVAYNNGDLGNAFANVPINAGSTYYFQLGETSPFSGGPITLNVDAHYTGPVLKSLSVTKGSHKGGNTIILTGTGFSAVSYMYWNLGLLNSTNFTVVSNTKIKFKVPPGIKGARVVVQVTTGAGVYSAVTPATHYTYN